MFAAIAPKWCLQPEVPNYSEWRIGRSLCANYRGATTVARKYRSFPAALSASRRRSSELQHNPQGALIRVEVANGARKLDEPLTPEFARNGQHSGASSL